MNVIGSPRNAVAHLLRMRREMGAGEVEKWGQAKLESDSRRFLLGAGMSPACSNVWLFTSLGRRPRQSLRLVASSRIDSPPVPIHSLFTQFTPCDEKTQ
jgi:hypothetical protein